MHLNLTIMEKASGLELWVSCHELKKEQNADYKSKQHVCLPASTYRYAETPLATSSAHNKWNQCLVPTAILKYPLARAFEISSVPSRSEGSSFSSCTARAYHKAAAPARVRREETWARHFQQQEHPRAAELLSSEASCSASVIPTHAVARAKVGSLCEQSESFHRESLITSKITFFSGKE